MSLTWILVVLFLPLFGFSQKILLSIGPEVAIPGSSSKFNNNRGTGFGGSLRIESSWTKHISGIATVEYISFGKKSPAPSAPTYTNQVNVIPIQVGIKYYVREKDLSPNGVFFSAEAGVMPTSNHITYTNGSKQNLKETGFSTALGLGYQYKKLESSCRLQYNLTASGLNVYYYNFRIAYAFLSSKK